MPKAPTMREGMLSVWMPVRTRGQCQCSLPVAGLPLTSSWEKELVTLLGRKESWEDILKWSLQQRLEHLRGGREGREGG